VLIYFKWKEIQGEENNIDTEPFFAEREYTLLRSPILTPVFIASTFSAKW